MQDYAERFLPEAFRDRPERPDGELELSSCALQSRRFDVIRTFGQTWVEVVLIEGCAYLVPFVESEPEGLQTVPG